MTTARTRSQYACSTPTTTRAPASLWQPRLAGLFVVGLLLYAASGLAQAQDGNGICRVTTGGVSTNDGADWSHPMDIMTALNNYQCTEVWVAAGVYPTDSYPYFFTIRSNVKVFGGFAGSETSRSQRDWLANVTVLSGDKDHNDVNTDGDGIAETSADIIGDNSHHVVKLTNQFAPITTAVELDGFTITAGDTREIATEGGGGLVCNGSYSGNQCNPTLENLVFSGNIAAFGGAMYLGGTNGGEASPHITHVTFIGNYAEGNGGAIYADAQLGGVSSPVLHDVVFSYNTAKFSGGGMYNNANPNGTASPSLTNVTFDHNIAQFYQGGGMMNYGYASHSSPDLTNVTFSSNEANSGGAMANVGQANLGVDGHANPSLRNVTFVGNNANAMGGAIYNYGTEDGGHASPTLTNVTFSGNSAGTYGGAMYNTSDDHGNTSPSLTNVIMWGNTAGTSGSNIHSTGGNNFGTININLDYSVVQGGAASITYGTGNGPNVYANGTGNLNSDPLLGTLANHGGLTQTLVPAGTGAAIDNGTCSNAPANDQRGVTRPQSLGCDIGAVEARVDRIFASDFE